MSEPNDLDLLLDAWARQHRLPEHRSDAIRRAITTPAAPSVDWWQSFTGQMADIVVWATGLPATYSPTRPPVLSG